jgi:hypothetical protein
MREGEHFTYSLTFFYGIAPGMAGAMLQAEEERKIWELAGARGITYLMAQFPGA